MVKFMKIFFIIGMLFCLFGVVFCYIEKDTASTLICLVSFIMVLVNYINVLSSEKVLSILEKRGNENE